MSKVSYFLVKAHKPLKAIEYIMSIGILWAGATSILLLSSDNIPEGASTFATIIEQFEVVVMVVFAMSLFAILDLIGLSRFEHPKSIGRRAVAMFAITIGFAFVSVLTILSNGVSNLLWVNEVTMAFIAAVLYLNLKVNPGNADR
jgi:hypothetical protein